MRTNLEDRERQYRIIYEAVYGNPRIPKYQVSSLLGVSRNTASNRMAEAVTLGYLSKPQIRLTSHKNLVEYLNFILCEDPEKLFRELCTDTSIVYHARMCGFANLWLTSREELSLDDYTTVIKGSRSDYHMSFAPNHSWETALKIMHQKAEGFDKKDYKPEGIIETRWDRTIEWDSEDEAIYRELKFDLTKPYRNIMRKCGVSWGKMSQWLERLPEHSSMLLAYYPKTISTYDPYLFMIDTDYEDFIIELFSELPTSSLFFKVSDRLFAYLYVKREFQRVVSASFDIRELHIPLLIRDLREKKIIKSETHSLVECYWQKSL